MPCTSYLCHYFSAVIVSLTLSLILVACALKVEMCSSNSYRLLLWKWNCQIQPVTLHWLHMYVWYMCFGDWFCYIVFFPLQVLPWSVCSGPSWVWPQDWWVLWCVLPLFLCPFLSFDTDYAVNGLFVHHRVAVGNCDVTTLVWAPSLGHASSVHPSVREEEPKRDMEKLCIWLLVEIKT